MINDSLAVAGDVSIDVVQLTAAVDHLQNGSLPAEPDDVRALLASGDLLPSWRDEWVVPLREQLHEVRLRGLELLAQKWIEAGRHHEALDVALEAAASDPLRESAHLVVLRAQLAMGNYCQAVRHYESLAARLDFEMGVRPSHELTKLLHVRASDGILL